LNQTHVDVGYR